MENEQVEQVKRETSDPKRELLSSIGLFIGTGLLGFWFGVGATLGSKMINSLEELISRKTKWQKKMKCNKLQKNHMKEPQCVTTNNPKKVEAGKKLAEHNCKKREEQKKEQAQLEKSGVNQYYGIGAVIALGVIGGLGYYIY